MSPTQYPQRAICRVLARSIGVIDTFAIRFHSRMELVGISRSYTVETVRHQRFLSTKMSNVPRTNKRQVECCADCVRKVTREMRLKRYAEGGAFNPDCRATNHQNFVVLSRRRAFRCCTFALERFLPPLPSVAGPFPANVLQSPPTLQEVRLERASHDADGSTVVADVVAVLS